MDTLEDLETRKYRKVWKHKGYRKTSPAEIILHKFLDEIAPVPHASIIDLGCGTGRAARLLQSFGYHVTAIDIAANSLDPDVTLPHIQACLWKLPEDLSAKYGICCDVMEHIPPDRVDQTLVCIAKAVALSCFFSISFQPDNWGRATIGEPLHLTVQPQDWWHKKLGDHFKSVKYIGNQGVSGIFIASH